jgi:PAS domain S-box-containing protein
MDERPKSGVKRRVLIVDSDRAFGRSLAKDFTALGLDVETVETAGEAIARVATSPPDLVVLDLFLPERAACEMLKVWKVQAPGVVVVLVSGDASMNVVLDALNEGAHRFFTKPVTAAALIGELDQGALKTEEVDRFFAISADLLSVAGFDGYFKMLNPAWEKTLGYSLEELYSRPHLELVHPEDRDKATDEAVEIRGRQTVFRFKNRYRCKDGSYRWLAWSATPSPGQRLVYASARDVTKSVHMEQGLRQANQRLKRVVASRGVLLRESTVEHDSLVELGRFKDEVAAMLVHDLKNPLSIIVLNYDYILEGFEGSADCLEALRDSQSAGHRVLRLLANLVDVAHCEDGTLEVHRSQTNLAELLRPIAEQRRALVRSRHLEIIVSPAPEMTVAVDPDLVTRTIENIFDNACRHTPNGGTIEVAMREVGPDVEIRIGNSGSAIPDAARATIFDKHGQAGSEHGHLNLGLGLYFCRLATEAQGGRIWVEETDRLPTVFGIRLPRLVASA